MFEHDLAKFTLELGRVKSEAQGCDVWAGILYACVACAQGAFMGVTQVGPDSPAGLEAPWTCTHLLL